MGLYFRQLLSGQDYAVGDPVATQMVNFSYLIGDTDTREAVVVDPAYSPSELLATLDAEGMRLVGVLATHHHPDHVGGSMMGFDLVGVADLLGTHPVPIHVQRPEADYVTRVTGLSANDLTPHDHDDVVEVGDVSIRLLHTPGHTPGSQCFLVPDPDGGDKLVAGDTLFLQGCGRTDFPGGDAAQMYHSLQQLAGLKGNPTVYPGHRYSDAPSGPLEEVRRTNMVYRAGSAEQFVAAFGGMTPRAVVLVEGASDAAALETLARRRGRSADGVAIVVLHGYTNLSAALRALAPAAPERVAVLCDAGAERWVRRVLAPGQTCRVCRADLEDEMIRALGVDRVREIVAGQGELAGLRTLEHQPAHRDRTTAQHLHRFIGTRARRKERYGGLLAAALDLAALPEPLEAVLTDVGL